MSTVLPPMRTFADLLQRVGNVPPDRLRIRPFPATISDVLEIHDREGRLCELIDGVLLEKTVGIHESRIALFLGRLLDEFVVAKNLGFVTGADGMIELFPDLVRIPDIAFFSWDRLPSRVFPTEPVPEMVPDLAVEVLSRSNSVGEMKVKRGEYFEAGVRVVWEIEPRQRTVAVYQSPTNVAILEEKDLLDGGDILPGFALRVHDLFADQDRRESATPGI